MTFKIETIRKRADVFYTDGSRMSGSFFVSPVSPNHIGAELVSELLAGDRNFIPFESEDGNVALLQKENIKMIYLERGELNTDLPNSKQIKAQISFISGETMEGNVYYDLPESHSRLSDFLNSSKEFFYFELNNKDYLVNTQFIKMVHQLTSE
jgi:hypothetical protein